MKVRARPADSTDRVPFAAMNALLARSPMDAWDATVTQQTG